MRGPTSFIQRALGKKANTPVKSCCKGGGSDIADRWEGSTASPDSSDSEEGFASSGSEGTPQKDGVILFDWDDTLCPTWFLKNVHMEVNRGSEKGEYGPEFQDKWGPYCKELLAQHTRTIIEVLRAASAVANVGIVTLGNKVWVKQVLRDFLGGQGLEETLKELNIEFYYATLPPKSLIETDHSPGVRGKMETFKTAIMRNHEGEIMNITSIGDSTYERLALKAVMGNALFASSKDLCKTVKMPPNPDIVALTEHLRSLAQAIPSIVAHPESFDADWPDFVLPKISARGDTKKTSSPEDSKKSLSSKYLSGKFESVARMIMPTRRRAQSASGRMVSRKGCCPAKAV
jgi:hypothetical protein